MKLRQQLLLFLLAFGLAPLLLALAVTLPLVLQSTTLLYQKERLQNLRADFRDLDQHLASRHEMIRLLAKLPEPGMILGEGDDADAVDLARARYIGWVNQILGDQRDVVQILFLDADGNERFWLARDPRTHTWHPTPELPARPNPQLVVAALGMQTGGVMVSRIRIDPAAGAVDPRQLMTLTLLSAIGGGSQVAPLGMVALTIDVGGIAQFYRDTLWVNNNGSYIQPGQPPSEEPSAFRAFPGLAAIFAGGSLAVWEGPRGEQLLWVPMFITEDDVPLWVGRAVDPSPMESFRNALVWRVGVILALLVLAVMILARWIAAQAERFGQELTGGVGGVLRDGRQVQFRWRGPQEVRELARTLTALAETHVGHVKAAREHTAELEKSNRVKSELLANVSHELRTPLNSILLLSKMLANGAAGLPDGPRHQAEVIHAAGRDLRAMIDNVLDIARIESGQIRVNVEWITLKPLVTELLTLVSPQFEQKGLYLRLEVSDDAPEEVYSDREKLAQILKNFLSNAVKFTDRGGATLRIFCRHGRRCPVAIAVADTGIGIPVDKQDIIFEAFRQADGSTRRRYGGTGLGLSISRELAALLGGRIELSSAEGQGSCFTLLVPVELDASHLGADQVVHETAPLPVAPPPPPAPPEPGEEALAGRCALLVERDVQGLVAAAAMLESCGLAVQTAADADEAVDTLREASECTVIMVASRVLVDKTCDTIMAIRRSGVARGLPILVLGGELDAADKARCTAAGATGFVAKPCGRAELIAFLAGVLARKAADSEGKMS